jgi:hypothetical protein
MISLFFFQVACSALSAQTLNQHRPSDPTLVKGKGQLSFRMMGTIYHSNPTQTKCWTSPQVPLTILWAIGEDLLISWQLQQVKTKGQYRIERDSSGKVNFSIAGKSYWIRKTDGSNYLLVTITAVREVYNVKLLSGTFDAVLEDKEGNKVKITEGRFVTEDI